MVKNYLRVLKETLGFVLILILGLSWSSQETKIQGPTVLKAFGLRIISPNGGERIGRHEISRISWSYYGYERGTPLIISLSSSSRPPFEICRGVPIERGSYDWGPTNVPGMYRIEISTMGPGGRLLDRSDGEFEIYSSTSVRVLSPNGDELFNAGGPMDIRWEVTNPWPTQRVKIALCRYSGDCRAGGSVTLLTPVPVLVTDRSYRFDIPPVAMGGQYFTVRLIPEVPADFLSDESDNCFRIYSRTRVHVLYPNGGQTFGPADRIDVRWEATDALPGQKVIVSFCYYLDRCHIGEKKCGRIWWVCPIGDGHYTFLARTLEGRPRSTYLARVLAEGGDFPEDTSDDCFTIN